MTVSSQSSIFEDCLTSIGSESTHELLKCVTDALEKQREETAQTSSTVINDAANDYARSVLLVYAAALIFFMQAGFAMVCAGAVRRKNVQNTMLKNLLDACGASVAFFTVGYAFAYGGMDRTSNSTTFIGTENFFLIGVEDYSFWMFEYAFSAASATIVAGALAERCQMVAYLCYSFMLTGWVYPVVCHSIWSPQGFLSAYSVEPMWGTGMVDFAGSAVVHVTGGMTALFATIILGPRRGRFHDDSGRELAKPREFRGHSAALQMLGTFILWFGWYGFNSGNALLLGLNEQTSKVAALAAANTTLSGGTSGIVALMANLWWLDRTTGEAYFDLKFAMNGAISGLVAIAAGCAFLEPWAAVVVGFVSGLLYTVGSRVLVHFHIDDAVDAIPVHLFNGLWGTISVGLLASPTRLVSVYGQGGHSTGHGDHAGLFYSWSQGNSDATLLGAQLCGLLFVIGWVMFVMIPFFIWLDFMGWFRSDALEEIVGLDTSYHGGLALVGHASDDGVTAEHLSEFKKQREEAKKLRRRVFQMADDATPATNTTGDNYDEDESDDDEEECKTKELHHTSSSQKHSPPEHHPIKQPS